MNKLASRVSALSLSLFVVGAAVGCGMSPSTTGEDVDQATQLLSSDGAEAVTSSDQSTAELTDMAFEATSAAASTTAIADVIVATPADPVDAKCRSRAKDPNDPSTVIITLNDCTGRFGKRHVSGTEIVHFTKGADGVIHADFHSENLTVNGKPATHTASADITVSGTERSIVWQGAWNRSNDKGDPVAHTSDLTIVVDTVAHCRTRNGTSMTKVGEREIHTQIQDLHVCRDASGDAGCPTGTVVHANQANGKTVTVSFDGSTEAHVSTSKGLSFDRPLVCGG